MVRKSITTPYGYIYITTDLVNGMKYIGQRAWSMPDKQDYYIGSGKAFQNAVKKRKNKKLFSKEIIDWANSKEELDQLERYYIAEYDAVKSDDFYNIQEGGGSWGVGQLAGEKNPFYGRHHSNETKQKIRDNKPDQSGENNGNYGNKWSEGQKQNASDRMKGKMIGELNPNYGNKWSDEQRQHMSEMMTGRFVGEKSPMYGTHLSEETKKKLSDSHKLYAIEHPWSDERRQQMSKRVSGDGNGMYGRGELVSGNKNGMYGKSHSEETKRKLSQNHADMSGKNNPNYGKCRQKPKGIVKLSKDKKLLIEYRSVTQAIAMEGHTNNVQISKHCNSKGTTLYHDSYWMWSSDYYSQEV